MRLEKDQIITGGVIAAILIAYGLLIYLPGQSRQQTLQADIHQTRQQLSRVEGTDLEALRQEVDEQLAQLDAEQRQLTSQDDKFSVLGGLSKALRDHGIPDGELTQNDLRHHRDYSSQKVDIDFGGSFAQTCEVLQAIESMAYPVRVEYLELNSDPGESSGELSVVVHLNTFYEGVQSP